MIERPIERTGGELAPIRPLPRRPAEPAAGDPRQRLFRRSDVYLRPVVDGRELPDNLWTRLVAWLRAAATSEAARREAALDAGLRATRRVSRTNTLAVVSPKGGVGKTTCTFLLGNLLASHLNLRTLAVDANRDFGTLASLAPDEGRVERSLADVLADMRHIRSAPEISPYVSKLPSGLHVLAAPERAEVMAEMTPTLYGDLLAFLAVGPHRRSKRSAWTRSPAAQIPDVVELDGQRARGESIDADLGRRGQLDVVRILGEQETVRHRRPRHDQLRHGRALATEVRPEGRHRGARASAGAVGSRRRLRGDR